MFACRCSLLWRVTWPFFAFSTMASGGDFEETRVANPRTCTIESLFRKQDQYLLYSGDPVRTYAEQDRAWRIKMARAVAAYQNCTGIEGRFWVATVDFPENATDFYGERMSDYLGDLATDRRALTVCAPALCSAVWVREVMVPMMWFIRLWASIHKQETNVAVDTFQHFALRPETRRTQMFVELPAVRRMMRVEVQEMASWDQIELSWAVLGFPGMGTSSLMMNLHMHPEFEAVYAQEEFKCWEEHFFLYGRIHHLPLASDVAAINARRIKLDASSTMVASRLRGVKRTSYVMSPSALARLALVPGLKTIVVVRDPVEVVERTFIIHMNYCALQHPGMSFPCLDECFPGPCAVPWCAGLEEHTNKLLQGGYMASQVYAAAKTLGKGRLLVVDFSELAQGRRFYDALAMSLGASKPYVADARFDRRANVRSRDTTLPVIELRRQLLADPRTGACHARGLANLRGLLRSERLAVRDLLRSLPSLRPTDAPLPSWAAVLSTGTETEGL